jgi:hypothetical protein
LEAQNVIIVVEELSYLNACYFVLAFACGGLGDAGSSQRRDK